nr:MerR family transcriptional regulator [Agilicoccus flavus]
MVAARTGASTGFTPDDDAPVFVISVAAQLAGMHAQTLRQYDRLGIVVPRRTRGGGRRYSARDVTRLREVQRLSQEEGVSLAGISRILDLENQVTALQSRVAELSDELARTQAAQRERQRVFAAGAAGDVVAVRAGQRPARAPAASRALVVWRPGTRS